jgi:prepilin-type N-terminal cleavage/methylation domain-containing protein
MKKKSNTGFSLIELLISLFLLSFILLGLDAIELYSMRKTRDSLMVNSAINQLNNMTEWLRVNGKNKNSHEQIATWNLQNAMLLPSGQGSVEGSYPTFSVSIFWGEYDNHTPCKKNQLGVTNCLREEIILSPA